MPQYRSRTSTAGRNMAGARALWRATGMQDEDFEKPIIAVVNSFTQFVPGHVHLKDLGQLVAREIEAAGGVAKEFNTIAVDDGIAMGHDGMLYSLPSRDLIADSVEYMVNAHCADAMVCISNCDKITPGMLNAAMRLNIPVVFVSGGPMEAGKTALSEHKLDLVDAMVIAADQMLEFEGRWLDKPLNQAEGAARLREFSGKEHRLITAVVLQQDGNVLLCRTDFAVLRARDRSDGFIAGYVSTMGDEICRSVGGSQLEGLGAQLFEHVDGDFFSILGLSLLPLMAALRENGALSA